ncbi:MAG: hypothetical protein H0V51_11425, partial [Chloroflexi bacterium]|nr:hypothetical protein [Chloroflexota bacterium]
EEVAHTTGEHRLEIDAVTGGTFDAIERLTVAILRLPAVARIRRDLERDFRGILTPETLRRWGRQYARLRGEADDG